MILRSIAISLIAATLAVSAQDKPADATWTQLFNGKNLDGWTPKIRGCELGENYLDTFRVEDGVLKVCYDKYANFDNRFGHLFYKTPFQSYILRVEYRFTGEQTKGGPAWAFRNSGIMIHGQDPATMGKDQNFPASLEVQLLGGDGKAERSTGNLCTPGTLVTIDGQLRKEHCINSKSKTFHGDQWVTAEVEVRGSKITHRINGEVVIQYDTPLLDENDGEAKKLIKDGNKLLTGGTISLQSESHPCEFRKVEIKPLKE